MRKLEVCNQLIVRREGSSNKVKGNNCKIMKIMKNNGYYEYKLLSDIRQCFEEDWSCK
jgi:hypothetical protein